jgi:hypothetical protein
LREVADRVITIDGRLLKNCWKNSNRNQAVSPMAKATA